MRFFPTYIALDGRLVVVSGAGDCAVPKLRLLLKTSTRIAVFGTDPCKQVLIWAQSGLLELTERSLNEDDIVGATLLYCANDDTSEDKRALKIGKRQRVLTNIVDNLRDSQFITPAIVDRDPVTIAIGTEGTAPLLARRIKARIEELLPSTLGALAVASAGFRNRVAVLRSTHDRRRFWTRFFDRIAPLDSPPDLARQANDSLESVLAEIMGAGRVGGKVVFVGAGPGDPELMTLKSRRALDRADVVLHDRLVPSEILELARREAEIINVGKKGFGSGWKQSDINDLVIRRASEGELVVRLKSGDPSLFGRLDEEIAALDVHGIEFEVIPGVTAASAAAASMGRSLTRRGRNSTFRIVTGHDLSGFTNLDWRELAKPGAITSIYMGKRAARFIRGRLLMHGADESTPVTVMENVSQTNQRAKSTELSNFPEVLEEADFQGPTTIIIGVSAETAGRSEATRTASAECV